MGQRREQVVCVAVCDRSVPAGGGQQPSHAVVAVSGGDALRVSDGVDQRTVGVVRVGDGVPVASGDGSRNELYSRLRMRLYYIKSLMQNLTYS